MLDAIEQTKHLRARDREEDGVVPALPPAGVEAPPPDMAVMREFERWNQAR